VLSLRDKGRIKMKLKQMKIKTISLLTSTLILLSIVPAISTAKNLTTLDANITPPLDTQRGELIKITDEYPVCDLDAGFVVYADDSSLYLYDIKAGETDTVFVGGNIVFPKISENRVVYYDFSYMGFKMYDINTTEKTNLIITNWTGGDTDDFQFSGDYIVYENTDSGQYDTEIYLYNIVSGENIQLTESPGDAFAENPCIYKNIIAWQLTEGNLADIVMFNIESTEYTRVTNTSQFESETYPSVYENTIVYHYFYYDKLNGTILYALKLYDTTTQETTTIFSGEEPTAGTPELYGNMIVYSKPSVGLYLYDLSTNNETTIYETPDLVQPWNLNDNYVVFTVLGEGVYLYTYTNPPQLTITITGGFGISATIKNTGTTDMTNIDYTISLNGGLVFIGKSRNSTIPTLAAGEEITVKDFVIGFGSTGITVSAGNASTNTTGTVFLFFVFGVK
jgi:hypothetical protein